MKPARDAPEAVLSSAVVVLVGEDRHDRQRGVDAITRIMLVIQAYPPARMISPRHANPGVGPSSRGMQDDSTAPLATQP
jgi:hypothetical protein